MTGTPVQSIVHTYDEALPAEIVSRFKGYRPLPNTWGEVVAARLADQAGGYNATYPFGSQVTGWDGR